MRAHILPSIIFVGLALLLAGCGGEEIPAEIAAQLDEYENLIAEFEPQFAAVRNDPPEFRQIAATYEQRTQAWLGEFSSLDPDLTPGEGKALKSRLDELNRRAVKMLTGA